MKTTYKVNIIETLQMEVEIEADNAADAKLLAMVGRQDGKYVLDSSNLKNVNFTVQRTERGRNYVR